MKILPKIGVDDIRLGSDKNYILDNLGKPNEIVKEEGEELWRYDKGGLELCFQEDDRYLLSTITVFDKTATLESKTIIGIGESELVIEFPFFKLDDDFGEFGKDYNYNEKELSVWVDDAGVRNITIFPEYDKSGERAIWPKAST